MSGTWDPEDTDAGAHMFTPYPARTVLDWAAVVIGLLPLLVFTYCVLWFLTRWLAFMMLTPGRWFGYAWAVPFALAFFGIQERAFAEWRRGIVRRPPVATIFQGLVGVTCIAVFFYLNFVRQLNATLMRDVEGMERSVAAAGRYLYWVSIVSSVIMNAAAWILRRHRYARADS